MAEQVEVKILTTSAVTNLAELREAIKKDKETLDGLTVGTEEYQEALGRLIGDQNLLRAAMNGTTASMDDLKSAADGTAKTYNGLVNQMAQMKRELRNIDVSTKEGKEQFKKLAEEIKGVNEQLKDMDAMKGDYQRNVGNYASALNGLEDILKGLPPTLGAVKEKASQVGETVGLLSKQPILGILGLLAPLIMKVTESLGENKTAMDAVKKVMDALKPVTKFFEGILQKIADFAGEALKGVADFIKGALPQIKGFVDGVAGVGNAIFQFLIFPIRQTIEAFKGLGNVVRDVFTGQWGKIKEDAKAAIQGLNDAFTKGIDFKGNYKAGEKAASSFIDGLSSTKFKKKGTGKNPLTELLKDIQEDIYNEMDSMNSEITSKVDEMISQTLEAGDKILENAKNREAAALAAVERRAGIELETNEILTEKEQERAAKAYEIQKAANEKRLALLEQYRKAALERGDVEQLVQYEQDIADTQVEIELNALAEKKRLRELDKQNAIETLNAIASSTSSILGTIADAMEGDTELTEREAKRVKALRIAAATIDMIQGAVTAYSTAQSLGPIAGPIVGAANAAAVVAAGMANIAKIKSTTVSADAGASSVSAPAPATVSAPSIETAVPTTTVTEGASQTTRLNAAASPQKVYILQSDIEAAGEASKTQVAESTF